MKQRAVSQADQPAGNAPKQQAKKPSKATKSDDKSTSSSSSAPSKVINDSRFSHVQWDARFGGVSSKKQRLKVDSRFKSMFDDESFNTTCMCETARVRSCS